MSPPDLSRVHPVIRTWVRRVLAELADLAHGDAVERAAATELAEPVTLERWSVGQDRWGLLRLKGVLVAHDGEEFRFQVSPVAVDPAQRRVWTSVGWVRLGAHAELPESGLVAGLLAQMDSWCAALREGLRDG